MAACFGSAIYLSIPQSSEPDMKKALIILAIIVLIALLIAGIFIPVEQGPALP